MKHLNQAIHLMSQVEFLDTHTQKMIELQQKLKNNELVISVIGQFKRGKSSLVNSFLGEEILPVGIIPLTAIATEIRYAEEKRFEVNFLNQDTRIIQQDELIEFVGEQNNPQNIKGVLNVKIWTPDFPFGNDVVLIDTPGVGSIYRHNTSTSYDIVEKSDVVLFLLSVDSPVSETEREFLVKTKAYTSSFFFVVNKIDTVEDSKLKIFLDYCSKVIAENIEKNIILYPVSSKYNTGIQYLITEFKATLDKSRDTLLSESVDKKFAEILFSAKQKIDLFLLGAKIPEEEFKNKIELISENRALINDMRLEIEILLKNKTKLLTDEMELWLDDKFKDIILMSAKVVDEKIMKGLSSREAEKLLKSKFENYVRSQVSEVNEAGLRKLYEGYGLIVMSVNKKINDVKTFIADLTKKYFNIDYQVLSREYSVSERNDFYIRIISHEKFLFDVSDFVHLLPDKYANKWIYKTILMQTQDDLLRNKNNLLYNYKYKLQESLRPMVREVSEDILNMDKELSALFAHIQEYREKNKENLLQVMKLLEEIKSLKC